MDEQLPAYDRGIDGVWERMRGEERAERFSHVVQDAARDARLAEALTGTRGGRLEDGDRRSSHRD